MFEAPRHSGEMAGRIALVFLLVLAANADELPDTPSRVADKPFMTLLSIEAAAKSADFAETAARLGKHHWVPCIPAYACIHHGYLYTVQEDDPWFGKDPSTARMIGENIGFFGAESLVAYEMKKPHEWLPGDRVIRKLWWIPLAYQIQAHARFAYRDSQF